jgi:hypothetical protein
VFALLSCVLRMFPAHDALARGKVARLQVEELVAAGRAVPFAPNGRTFKE